MVFNSYIFILCFLPVVVSGYFFVNKKGKRVHGQTDLIWLLVMSLIFFAYSTPVFLFFLIFSIVVNYEMGNWLKRLRKKHCDQRKLKRVLRLGIGVNLLPLVVFKYTNFLLGITWDIWYTRWNWNISHPLDIAVPLGISFFTFMQIGYLVDCYREENGFSYTLLEYATYVAFFPKITMGPIAFHDDIIPQFRDETKKNVNYNNLSQGVYGFTLGLAKKVLLADSLAKIVNTCYADIYYLNTMTCIVVMFTYTLQLYFDFSGYCDMAMGVAKMINIELPLNFNSPYKAKSISEFWNRWHMTLTRFFTRYVYIPLGGSRRGKIRTYVNTMIVFLLSGLWHGADWGYLIWGALHGCYMVIEKIGKDFGVSGQKLSRTLKKSIDRIKGGLTFILVSIAWMFFRAGSFYYAKIYFRQLFSGGWKIQNYATEVFNNLIEIRILKRFGLSRLLEANMDITIWAVIISLILVVVFMKNTQQKIQEDKYTWKQSIFSVILLVWCIVSLSDVSEFLYFNF